MILHSDYCVVSYLKLHQASWDRKVWFPLVILINWPFIWI